MNASLLTLKKSDYILTFKVQGVSVFMTDMSRDMYRDLAALYIVHNDTYYQYFRTSHFEQALQEGIRFFSNRETWVNYKERIQNVATTLESRFTDAINASGDVRHVEITTLFEDSIQFLRLYSRMDFEYTDKAYLLADENEIIAANLRDLAAFKDVMRAFINKAFFEPTSYLSRLFDKLSTQFSVSTKNLNRYLQKDILALYDDTYVADDELKARANAFVTFTYEDQTFTLSGADASVIVREFEETVIPDRSVIKGQTANGQSVIQGKVKIIPVDYSDFHRVNKEIEKMEPGDILVAETTAPELMLACKKAAAIITDLGGLLSHAAIVSRELGIPCIVNTKHASRVLKDGDIVEIDTTRGVVRRMELIKNTLK